MSVRDDHEHLRLEELDALLASRLPFEDEIEALLHLLACAACERELRSRHPVTGPALLLDVFGRKRLPKPPSRVPGSARLQQRMAEIRRSVAELEDAERLWSRVAAESPEHRSLRVRNVSSYWTLGMAVVLLERCRSRWLDAPKVAAALAADALAVLELCDGDHDRLRVNDIAARAHGHRGNCLRILCEPEKASKHLLLSRRRLQDGTGDHVERTEHLEFESSLLRDQRRLPEAMHVLTAAAREYRATGNADGEARVVIQEALVFREMHQPARGVTILRPLLARDSLEDIAGDSCYRALHNLVILLAESGRIAEAKLHLPRVRRMAERQGSRFDRVRGQWLEAIVHDHSGEVDLAELSYRHVRDFFLAAGIECDAALVGLELSSMLLRAGRLAEVRRLVPQALSVFQAYGLEGEGARGLAMLRQAGGA